MRNAIVALLLGAFLAGSAFADDRAEFDKRFRKLRKSKSHLKAHEDLMQWAMERGMMKEALKVVEQARKIDPRDPHFREVAKEIRRDVEKMEREGGPQGGDRPGAKPRDPGLRVKTPDMLGGDGNRIREYVDSVMAYGRYLWEKGDKDRARKYFDIILKHYQGARQQVEVINALYDQDKHSGKSPRRGGNDGFKNPLEFENDEDEGDNAADKRAAREEDEVVPEAPGQKVTGDGEKVPDGPVAGGGGDEVPDGPKASGGDEVPEPEKVPEPEITGKDPKKTAKKGDKQEPEEEDEDAVEKRRKKEAKYYARFFEIKSFRVGSNSTFSGSYPQLELVFKNYKKPKFITLVWYGYSRNNKVFRASRTFLGPEVNKRHAIVAAYKKEWVKEHGRLVAGRCEFWYGPRKERYLMRVVETDTKRKYTKNANWYKPGIDDPVDHMGFYRPKQNNFETNTLKRIKRKYWENRD